MLMRFDPFRELDRFAQQALRTAGQPGFMALDAYRHDNQFVVTFDLPGVDPSTIDLTVEKNVLQISAERQWQPSEGQEVVASERPQGSFSRQLFLGEGLDAEGIQASYENGVLTVTVPVAEQAKPRKVEISSGGGDGGGGGKAKAIEAEATAA